MPSTVSWHNKIDRGACSNAVPRPIRIDRGADLCGVATTQRPSTVSGKAGGNRLRLQSSAGGLASSFTFLGTPESKKGRQRFPPALPDTVNGLWVVAQADASLPCAPWSPLHGGRHITPSAGSSFGCRKCKTAFGQKHGPRRQRDDRSKKRLVQCIPARSGRCLFTSVVRNYVGEETDQSTGTSTNPVDTNSAGVLLHFPC